VHVQCSKSYSREQSKFECTVCGNPIDNKKILLAVELFKLWIMSLIQAGANELRAWLREEAMRRYLVLTYYLLRRYLVLT